ncbi:MAG: hypothetical protein ACRDPG_10520 [Nocardioidaceae bacterium]
MSLDDVAREMIRDRTARRFPTQRPPHHQRTARILHRLADRLERRS